MADITLTPVSAETINDNFDTIETAVNAKAELNGDSTEKFNVADAVAQTEAINKKQLDNGLAAKLDLSDTTVTKQGNTFNGANQLVQLNSSGQLPALDGHLLTGIAAATLDTSNMSSLANNSTDANNDIDISSGFCWNDSLTVKLQLTSTLVKQLDAAWASGSNAGGLDTGSKAVSTWYHVFLISNGTTTDALFSTSATSPTMPNGYTYKRRIGSVKTDSSGNILGFYQVSDYFWFNSVIVDLFTHAQVTNYTDIVLSVPPLCVGMINFMVGEFEGSNQTCYFYIKSKVNNAEIMPVATVGGWDQNYMHTLVDSSSKVQYKIPTQSTSTYIYTMGFIDKRGVN